MCDNKVISSVTTSLVPDAGTPKSSIFSNKALSINACQQKTASCGTRNNTIAESSSTPLVLIAKALNTKESCSWIVKLECGLPKVKVTMDSEFKKFNTKVYFTEYQKSLVDSSNWVSG